MAGPLKGIRVLDLTRVMAGPWCTQILADLGADVIKIERPGIGDETRQWGPPWLEDPAGAGAPLSAYYLSANRGKRSLTLDITQPRGREILIDITRSCDIFIENFKTGSLARKALGYDDLRAVKPDLIHCSITGFGQTGPRSAEPGYDYVVQAMGGFMSLTGAPDGQPGAAPTRAGLAVGDLTTGMNATIAILGALYRRAITGEGQSIDISLLDVQVSWLANQALNYFIGGQVPGRTGEWHPNLAPYQPFPTSDGSLIVAIGNDRQFARFAQVLGVQELAVDPRFSSNPARVANREVLAQFISEQTRRHSSEALAEILRQASLPVGVVNTIDKTFADPQVLHRAMKVETQHPVYGSVPGVANPIKYGSDPITYGKAPPALGEDSDDVLSELIGAEPAMLQALRRDGVI